MENRALLAFVLSLAVFVVWGYFLALIEGPREPKELPQEKTAMRFPGQEKTVPKTPSLPGKPLPGQPAPATPAAETPADGLPASAQPAIIFSGTEVKVTVDTGISTLVFSNKGGVVEQVLMNKFKIDDEPINLVQNVDNQHLPLTLVATDDTVTHILQNAFYEISAKNLVLDESVPDGTITFKLNHESGLEVVRTLTFHYGSYLFDIDTRISAPGYVQNNIGYQVLWGPGLGGKVSSHTDHFIFSGPTTFLNNERVETPLNEMIRPKKHKGELVWTGFQNKYFTSTLIPVDGIQYGIVQNEHEEGYVGLQFQSVQSAATVSYHLYAGTKELLVLEETGHKLVRIMDYGWIGNKFAFLVKPLLKILQYFFRLTGNYGWAIIIVTFLIKLLFFPLTHKSFKSMKGLQKVQPYVKVIQERNKDDRQKMNEEMIELYKKHRVNPLGGCLPMLLQIPVFISLYHVLFFSIELRGAPFLGWITDLSVADPYYVTPVLMGVTMFLQQKMTPSVGDPIQQKIMMFLPIMFTFLFITFPAGLVIYWTINNLLTIAQQYYIYKVLKD